jgi:hypothetical protein
VSGPTPNTPTGDPQFPTLRDAATGADDALGAVYQLFAGYMHPDEQAAVSLTRDLCQRIMDLP